MRTMLIMTLVFAIAGGAFADTKWFQEIRVGGGHGETVVGDGGCTIESDGDILTDGDLTVDGTITGGTGALGTMAIQDADSVAITGGAIDGTVIGGVTPAAGTFTTLIANDGTLEAGVDDTTNGTVYVFGDNTTAGGAVRIYNGVTNHSNTNYYVLVPDPSTGDLEIGPLGVVSILIDAVSGNVSWPLGVGTLGVADTMDGIMTLAGDNATAGGILWLENGDTNDGNVNKWGWRAGATAPDGDLYGLGDAGVWISVDENTLDPTIQNDLYILGDLDVTGTITAAFSVVNPLNVGTDTSDAGVVNVYSDSGAGGMVNMYVDTDDNGTTTFWRFDTDGGNFRIVEDGSSAKFDMDASGDLAISGTTTAGALVASGSGGITTGVADSQQGSINVKAFSSAFSGYLAFDLPPDLDTNTDQWILWPKSAVGDMEFLGDTNVVLRFDEATYLAAFPQGNLDVGVSDTTVGVMTLWADAANAGEFRLALGNNVDVIDYFYMKTNPANGNFEMGTPAGVLWRTYLATGTNEWAYGADYLSGNIDVQSGYITCSSYISAGSDTDIVCTLGRAKVGFSGGFNDAASFSHIDHATANSIAFIQYASGSTRFNSASGQDLTFCVGGTVGMTMEGTGQDVVIDNDLDVEGDDIYSDNVAYLNMDSNVLTSVCQTRIEGDFATHLALRDSGTAAIGTDMIIRYVAMDDSPAFQEMGTVRMEVMDETSGTEDADHVWENTIAGATSQETMRLGVDGLVLKQDLVFSGTGNGHLYGEIYGIGNSSETTIGGTGEANKVIIATADTNGLSNGMSPDHSNDYITVDTAGVYRVTMCVCTKSVTGGQDTFSFSVFETGGDSKFVNTTRCRDLFTQGTDIGSSTCSGLIDLAATDTIAGYVWNNDDASNIVIVNYSLILEMVGGT